MVEFLKHSGLAEYAQNFIDNQIVGENLLKMTDKDMRDLGITAQGHIVKFRNAILKLSKINSMQYHRRRLEEIILPMSSNNNKESVQHNKIDWGTDVIGETRSDDEPCSRKRKSSHHLGSEGSKKSSRTSSGAGSDKRRPLSAELTCQRLPERKASDLMRDRLSSANSAERSKSDDKNTSHMNTPTKIGMGNFQGFQPARKIKPFSTLGNLANEEEPGSPTWIKVDACSRGHKRSIASK